MAKIKLNKKFIGELLQDQDAMENIEQTVGKQIVNKMEETYEDTEWETEIRSGKTRKRLIIKTDNREVPFREASTGKARKALRRGL